MKRRKMRVRTIMRMKRTRRKRRRRITASIKKVLEKKP